MTPFVRIFSAKAEAGASGRASDQPESRTVLIPLAGRPGDGRIGAVEAVMGRTEYQLSDTDPVVVELIDVQLYESGLTARRAARQLPQTRRSLRLLSTAETMRLRAADHRSFQGLSDENGRSAELGLALALLMLERRSPLAVIAATGTLEPPSDGSLSGDRLIGPVEGLSEKFAALGSHLARHKGGAWGRKLHLLLPKRMSSGALVLEARAEELDALREAARSSGVELEVSAVERLSEAARIVGATGRRKNPREIWARLGAAAGMVFAACFCWFCLWALRPVKMDFAPVQVERLGGVATPARTVYSAAAGGPVPQPHCLGPDGASHILAGAEGISFAVTAEADWAPVWAYEFLVVVVGQKARRSEPTVKIYSMETLEAASRPQRGADGEIVWGMRLPIQPPPNEMKLFVLARKLIPFKTTALERGLAAHMASEEAQGRRINAAMSYLRGFGTSRLDYSFHGVEDLSGCILSEGL